MALAAVAVAVFAVMRQDSDLDSVGALDRGDCVDGRAFLQGKQPALSQLTRADCDDPHDAEVLLMLDLDDDQAAAYRPVVPDLVCLDALDGRADVAVDDQRLLVAGVADSRKPAAGDQLACFGFAADGTRLEGHVRPR
ncbi:hypothetical protein [uncultured Nocardioides sp.]|uniref:hypothetical protein n=1 Tax=uncultured Nocardioides sp. TaxID=198441 RepID=UPI00263563F5|nr:hypothetical protein [uncultured Nocardioides sp.]